LGRLVGKKIIEKYPHLKEVHGFHMNDFGYCCCGIFGARHGNPLGILVRKLLSIFHWKRKKYQDKLSKKQWQDLIDFEGMPMVLRS
jgi:dGTPase